jgi:anti-sigma regulatory factor (Ser/Thr protein kinase)
MEWSQTYPGLPSMVPAIRAFVRGLLDGTPRQDDAELIASEFTGNALLHTPSGQDGGEVSVTVASRPGWARIAVSDSGTGDWVRPLTAADALGDYGRGLVLVESLADKMGHEIGEAGQTMWAELTWSVEP